MMKLEIVIKDPPSTSIPRASQQKMNDLFLIYSLHSLTSGNEIHFSAAYLNHIAKATTNLHF